MYRDSTQILMTLISWCVSSSACLVTVSLWQVLDSGSQFPHL